MAWAGVIAPWKLAQDSSSRELSASRATSLDRLSRSTSHTDLEELHLAPGRHASTHGLKEEESDDDLDGEDLLELNAGPVEEDTYGYAIASIVRDLGWLTKESNLKYLRLLRLTSSFILLLWTIGLQVFLLHFVRKILTARSVHDIRHTYSDYERHMYPNHTTSFYAVGATFFRGVDGYRVDSNFETLEKDTQDYVCEIPLSQPLYLSMILLLWAMTCVYQLRQITDSILRCVWRPKTVISMQYATSPENEDPRTLVVEGLTVPVKVVLLCFVFMPQVLVNLYLLWLGSRWLVSTADLEELLLNAVALEFVANLKDGIYQSFVPLRSKLETQNTKIMPHKKRALLSCWELFSSFGWAIAAIMWSVLYINWQRVLVDYKWDVRDLCEKYLTRETAG